MMIILKNIWRRRASNIWLFIELVVVTIVTWVIIDPVVVSISDSLLPLGYDEDRLFYIQLSERPVDSPLYIKGEVNNASRKNNIDNIVTKLKAIDGIESVGLSNWPLDVTGIGESFICGDEKIDTANIFVNWDSFDINERKLSTIGAEATEDSPSVEALENMPLGPNDIIITESVDRYYFPDHRGVNEKYLLQKVSNPDFPQTKYKVVGIIKDIRYKKNDRNTSYIIHNSNDYTYSEPGSLLIVRVKDNIDTEQYINDNYESLRQTATAGNYYVWDITSVTESNRRTEYRTGITAQRNLRISLALLFLVNLALGVVGTVWFQTRRRISEIGIRRSFGAMKFNIRAMIVGENIALSAIAIVTGLLLYFQYAIKEGLYDSVNHPEISIQSYSWVSDFGVHFAIVSAIVAAIILICVAAGSYLPARKASNVEPVDALRDE